MIASNYERIRKTTVGTADDRANTRRATKRQVTRSARMAVRRGLRDPRTW